MKTLLSLIISGALVVSGYAQTRNVLVGTNNAVVQPTNFWSADASNARTGLGLGSAALSNAESFQPSSSALTNLSLGDGGALTNLSATSIVGQIPSSNLPTVSFTNLSGTLSIAQGGTSATNAANARQNLGSTTVGDAVFIAPTAIAARVAIGATAVGANLFTLQPTYSIRFLRINADNTVSQLSASDFRTALSLGTASTNPASAFQPSSLALTNLASGNGGALTNLQASSVTGTIAISNGGSGATTAGGARTNLGLGEANNVIFNSAKLSYIQWDTNDIFIFDEDPKKIYGNWEMTSGALSFLNSTNAATTRTNLGIGWSALTNTTASGFQTALFGTNTNPVLVNTNGEVVSPTNFWQAAPIATTLQNSVPEYIGTTISTNAATNARLLFLFSLSGVQTGVTNVITLPTNGSTFNGDVATITHSGPTNSVTAVRQLGASTNIITLNQPEESVRFLYRNNQWTLMDNISYVEPIYFSGTNAAANAAASRTNLGLGSTNNVVFNSLQLGGPTNAALFILDEQTILGDGVLYLEAGQMIFKTPIEFNNTTNSATTRTNLGLGATNNVTFAGLTNNGDITINQTATNNGLLYIYRTNAEPFLGLANFIASNNVTVSNESLFRVGVAEATNKAAQFGFRSTNTNGNGVAVFSVFGYNALMMIGPSDPAAGTNPIQATIYSIAPTNKVMTLITTNTGATLFHRPIEFETTTNAATTRTNLGLGGGITTNLILKNGANVDTYMNFSNGILIYGSTTPP